MPLNYDRSLRLLYRKVNQYDTQAIDFIGSYCKGTASTGEILPGYLWAGSHIDLNMGYHGPYKAKYIYLTVHKSPFTW